MALITDGDWEYDDGSDDDDDGYVHPSCPNCEVLCINGVACHETGCPTRHVNPATDEPYQTSCSWCGSMCPMTAPTGRSFCDDDCRESFYS